MAETEPSGGMPETTPNGTFEAWYNGQPDDVKSMLDNHISGLKTALNAERDNTKSLSKQIKDLQVSAEKGSALEKQLSDLQARLTESERHAGFIDGAHNAGCSNVKAAYMLAKANDDLWKRDGTPDWEAIKETAPEFFMPRGGGSAGSGTNTPPDAGSKVHPMDALIRKAHERR